MKKSIVLILLSLFATKTPFAAIAGQGSDSVAAKSVKIQELETKVREAEGRLKAIQTQISTASMELQLARLSLETAEAEEQLKAGAGKKDAKSKALTGALELKIRNLKSMVTEDFPALQELEARFNEARTGSDPGAVAATQQALNARRLVLSRKQTEVESAMARANGDEARAKMLDARLDQIRKQETIMNRQAPGASKAGARPAPLAPGASIGSEAAAAGDGGQKRK